MGRLIAIDYGLKRVGLAVTDPLQLIASPHETVATTQLIDYLKNYNEDENIEAFVVGMPKNLRNEDTHATASVSTFVGKLREMFPQKSVHLVDERFTSKMAVDAMVRGGMKKKERRVKENIDKISAAIILQSFLDSRQS